VNSVPLKARQIVRQITLAALLTGNQAGPGLHASPSCAACNGGPLVSPTELSAFEKQDSRREKYPEQPQPACLEDIPVIVAGDCGIDRMRGRGDGQHEEFLSLPATRIIPRCQ
jgi:hypothetical protein